MELDRHLDNLAELEQGPLNNTLSVYHALKEIALEKELDGLAVRCWPDFFVELDCAACGAMSMLSDGFGGDETDPVRLRSGHQWHPDTGHAAMAV